MVSDPIFDALERYSGVDQDAEEGLRCYKILTTECEGRGRELEVARECHLEQRTRADFFERAAEEIRTMLHEMEDERDAALSRVDTLTAERDAARADLAASRARETALEGICLRAAQDFERVTNADGAGYCHLAQDIRKALTALAAARPDAPKGDECSKRQRG